MNNNPQNIRKDNIHRVLAHSYTVYLVMFLIGVTLDFIFKIKIFSVSVMAPIGFLLLIIASVLIIWAQKTGRDLRKVKEVKREHFHRGPYNYTRIPTQLGISLLMLGFGVVANAFFVILSTILSFLIVKFVFMSKHDKFLTDKYGEAYAEYKKLVRF